MEVVHNITIDMVKKGVTPRVYAMQYDTNARAVCVEMLSNGEAWNPPEDAVISLSYQKPDGKIGFYSKLEDDLNAVSVSGNQVSLTLAHQALTVAGVVSAAIVAIKDNQRIAAFPFEIHVSKDPGAGNTNSDDYFNPQATANAVLFTPQTLTPEQQAQARRNIGVTNTGSTPIAYFYNNTELPPLPQWDKEEFPYAFISENIPYGQYDGYAYRLHLYAAPCYVAYDENGKVNRVFTEKNSPYQLWGGNTGAVAWDFSGDGNNLTGSVTNNLPLWVNADMYYNGNDPTNSLYMPRSNPVPVYPESGGSAADAVLFTPQTLTEEQKAQARENIGAAAGVGLPYFGLTATTIALNGEEVELAEEDKNALFSIIEAMSSAGKILPLVIAIPLADIMFTTVLSVLSIAAEGHISYAGNIVTPGVMLSVGLTVNPDGSAVIAVSEEYISGGDTEAIAAELEGILNAEY